MAIFLSVSINIDSSILSENNKEMKLASFSFYFQNWNFQIKKILIFPFNHPINWLKYDSFVHLFYLLSREYGCDEISVTLRWIIFVIKQRQFSKKNGKRQIPLYYIWRETNFPVFYKNCSSFETFFTVSWH